MIVNSKLYVAGLMALAVLFPSAAPAQAPTSAMHNDDAVATSPFGASGAAVDSTVLGDISGQADIGQFIQAENNSTVSRNSVSGNSVTGTISFDAQAFQNMNGLSVLSANSGNNVAINSSLNVNVSIHP